MRRLAIALLLGVFLLGCAPVTTLPAVESPMPAATITPSPVVPPGSQSTPQAESPPLPSPEGNTPLLITETSEPEETPMPASATPSLQPTPLGCLSQAGEVQQAEIMTTGSEGVLQYRVYLPPCYDAQPERSYAVLYLIHGWDASDDQWERLGIAGAADALIAAGEVSPFMIVMPRDEIWREPYHDGFGDSLVGDLLPWIDVQYRTQDVRQMRAIGGLSRGAAWALHLGLLYWDRFGAVGMHSGFVFYSDYTDVRGWLDDIPVEMMPRFYLDVGDNDSPTVVESAMWFESLLTERAIEHEWHSYVGNHDEAYWSAHLAQYLRWYSQGWE